LGVYDHCLEPDAQTLNLFQQRFEILLVVLLTRGYGEGEGHLRLGAACGVHPISKDEAVLVSTDAGFGVAPGRAVFRCLLAVYVCVGAVDGDDPSLCHSRIRALQAGFRRPSSSSSPLVCV